MTLERMDHLAIEVDDLDGFLAKLVKTGGLRVLRRGTATSTGARIALLGDRVGMKIELVENAAATNARFLHVAFRARDLDAALADAVERDWTVERGPNDIAAAKARSAFVGDKQGFEFQILAYEPDSPDVVEWQARENGTTDAT